jgi:hypothetical protein
VKLRNDMEGCGKSPARKTANSSFETYPFFRRESQESWSCPATNGKSVGELYCFEVWVVVGIVHATNIPLLRDISGNWQPPLSSEKSPFSETSF